MSKTQVPLQNVRFTVLATVDNISDTMPWYYTRCTTCRSKVSERLPHGQCRQKNPNTGIDYGQNNNKTINYDYNYA